jgi:hypothetical protein
MIFKKKETLPKKTTEESYAEIYTQIDTCCGCKIYLYIQQRFDYTYGIDPKLYKVCELHREAALTKHTDKVRSQLE